MTHLISNPRTSFKRLQAHFLARPQSNATHQAHETGQTAITLLCWVHAYTRVDLRRYHINQGPLADIN